MTDVSMVKVQLQDGGYIETLWATPVGPDLYRLDNSPFWAYGVSWNDVVEAHRDAEGALCVTRVVRKGGHRTVRVFFPKDRVTSVEAQDALRQVAALGASYEGMNPTYLAIDVPAQVNLADVTSLLTALHVQWEHADPTYAELHPDADSA